MPLSLKMVKSHLKVQHGTVNMAVEYYLLLLLLVKVKKLFLRRFPFSYVLIMPKRL